MSVTSLRYRLKDNDNLCFIHLPKNAGTTLISIIDNHFELEEICSTQLWWELTKISRKELLKYKFFRGHFIYGIYNFLPSKPAYITMLRHPVERAISIYEFWRNTSNKWLDKAIADYQLAKEVDLNSANEIKKEINIYKKAKSLSFKDFL